MRRFVLVLLAASSLLWLGSAHAATRPRYGGTLRVGMRAAPSSLDPADIGQLPSLEGNNLSSLLFDTLVALDDRGTPQPGLALSWQSESGSQRWQFKLRPGVVWQDETSLTAEQAAASLRVANPNWKILAAGDTIIIQTDVPAPDLPAELAMAHNGIAKRGGLILGTGPFAVKQWDAARQLTLVANNDYWGGRPFVDSIEIGMGQGFREQLLSSDLGKADVIEIAPEQAHGAAGENRRVQSSAPAELMALAFSHEPQSAEEGRLRQALALCIDRAALSSVLLQGGGEAAGGLLPDWMTGYAFLFHTGADLAAARQARGEQRQTAAWKLAYDANDPIARVVAERIVLNARDAGLMLQLAGSGSADLRLIQVPLISMDPPVALAGMAEAFHLPRSQLSGSSSEALYTAESALLQSRQVIPLFHLRISYGMSESVRNWSQAPDGSWHLAEVWLSMDK